MPQNEFETSHILSIKEETRDTVLILYIKSGIWDHEKYPTWEYGKRENMKEGTWNDGILKFE